jgi:general secretion pathway protein A
VALSFRCSFFTLLLKFKNQPGLPQLSSVCKTMYDHFFHYFGLRENPFHNSPDPRFYHSTPAHAAILSELKRGIETRHGLVVLTGDAGTGKTTILNYLLDWLRQRGISSSYLFHSKLKPKELLEFIVQDFGIPCTSKLKRDLLAAVCHWLIQRHNKGDCPVIVIDEAQTLSSQTLDALGVLLLLETSGEKLVQLLLAGQPGLEERLRQPELTQLRQHVMFHCRLRQLAVEETSRYIAARLATAGAADARAFPDETIRAIHAFSGGVPRIVNMLCEHALLRAYADQQQTICPETALCVATEFDLAGRVGVVGLDPISKRFGRLISTPEREAPAASLSESREPVHLPDVAVSTASAVKAPELKHIESEKLEPLTVSLAESTESAPLQVMEVSAPSAVTALEIGHSVVQEPEPVTVSLSESTQPAPPPVMRVSALSAVKTPKIEQSVAVEPEPLTAAPIKLTFVQTLPLSPPVPARPPVRQSRTLPPQRKRLGTVVLLYWQEVWRSFVRDWKVFLTIAARRKQPISSRPRAKIVPPITKWLRQPIKTNRAPLEPHLRARTAHKH